MDVIGIPGARIEHIAHAFSAELGSSANPIDAVLCAGLNDIRAGLSIDVIMSKIRLIGKLVGTINNSSFAVCTLPIPPSMAAFENSIVGLNDRILELNNSMEETQAWRVPQFHSWGRRGIRLPPTENPRNRLQAMPTFRDSHWREKNPQDQLHMADGVRLRMGKAILKYFEVIYEF